MVLQKGSGDYKKGFQEIGTNRSGKDKLIFAMNTTD
jgi:hypothetical protein